MFSLKQSGRIRGAAGDPLPTVFRALAEKGTTFRRAQYVLVAAGPGTGKSAFALNIALKAKVPCFYFSADSDAFTQLTRATAILTGCTVETASTLSLDGELPDSVQAELARAKIWFSYSASPTLDDIESSLGSYQAVFEDSPALIVVDNITNVIAGSQSADDPFAGLEALSDYLSDMARQTEACVLGLHHVTGPYNDGDKPIPLSGVKGQIARVPPMVLTLHKRENYGNDDTLCVSTVKNRGGKVDPSGNDFAELRFDGPRMNITDYPNFRL